MSTPEPRLPTLAERQSQQIRPPSRAAMYHSWQDLLFLHWTFKPDLIQQLLPPGLHVDTFDGHAWLGVVPFFMRNIRPWWCPAIPGLSHFQELNLRTYVVDEQGTPGVWFLSLDADCALAVWWGRTIYRLPYWHARMSHTRDLRTGHVTFTSQRRVPHNSGICRFEYVPDGGPAPALPGSLEFFLVERYILFASPREGTLYSGHVHHVPYKVSPARVDFEINDLFERSGLPSPATPPVHVLMSRGVDVEVFPLRPLTS